VADEFNEELLAGESSWGRPNERTRFVDVVLVRICRAMDAVAMAELSGKRARKRLLVIESEMESELHFEFSGDGRWRFVIGSWADGGRLQESKLLRPSIRGIARAARPNHPTVMGSLLRDAELLCAQNIAILGAASPSTSSGTEAESVDTLLARNFGLSPADIEALRSLGDPIDVGAGTTLMMRGSAGRELFFLLDGVVAVDVKGKEVRLGPGSVIGETAILTGEPRSATVRCTSDVVLLAVPEHNVSRLPDAAKGLLAQRVPA
jgi:uncharacterized cupin superfamily protein